MHVKIKPEEPFVQELVELRQFVEESKVLKTRKSRRRKSIPSWS
jgi:hypothetical protein